MVGPMRGGLRRDLAFSSQGKLGYRYAIVSRNSKRSPNQLPTARPTSSLELNGLMGRAETRPLLDLQSVLYPASSPSITTR